MRQIVEFFLFILFVLFFLAAGAEYSESQEVITIYGDGRLTTFNYETGDMGSGYVNPQGYGSIINMTDGSMKDIQIQDYRSPCGEYDYLCQTLRSK